MAVYDNVCVLRMYEYVMSFSCCSSFCIFTQVAALCSKIAICRIKIQLIIFNNERSNEIKVRKGLMKERKRAKENTKIMKKNYSQLNLNGFSTGIQYVNT